MNIDDSLSQVGHLYIAASVIVHRRSPDDFLLQFKLHISRAFVNIVYVSQQRWYTQLFCLLFSRHTNLSDYGRQVPEWRQIAAGKTVQRRTLRM